MRRFDLPPQPPPPHAHAYACADTHTRARARACPTLTPRASRPTLHADRLPHGQTLTRVLALGRNGGVSRTPGPNAPSVPSFEEPAVGGPEESDPPFLLSSLPSGIGLRKVKPCAVGVVCVSILGNARSALSAVLVHRGQESPGNSIYVMVLSEC